MKYIFDHYIKTETIFLHIDKHFKDVKENAHVKLVIADTIHHRLMDFVLSELDDVQQVYFLANVEDTQKHEDLLIDLQTWIEDFETKVSTHIKAAEKDILDMLAD